MLNFLFTFLPIHFDPRVPSLEEEIEFYHYFVGALLIVILILFFAVLVQRLYLRSYRHGENPRKGAILSQNIDNSLIEEVNLKSALVSPKDLLDPGLIFKYSLAKESVTEKTITIGQTNGNIKTYSTEIIDDHLTVYIRILENRRDKDIYDLPDKIYEEYLLDLRRDGKVMIYVPSMDNYREMGSRERIYIKGENDIGGDPTFPNIEARQPIRFRLGDRLNQDGKFINGFFEFHLFSQNYDVKTSAGIPKVEKNFCVRLYKIYPGYDTGSPNEDGLYTMIDPFATG